MATITVQPIILSDVVLTIGENEYSWNVTSVEFAPSSSLVTWKGLNPEAVFTFPQKATWQANLTYAQDWATTDSLSQYFYQNEGATVEATFSPQRGGPSFTASLVIVPGSIGGAIDTVGVASVSLGVNGRPVLVPVAP